MRLNEYNSLYLNIEYEYGYDIKIHAIQSALGLINLIKPFTDFNPSKIRFGYYCVITEQYIIDFQILFKIKVTKKLDAYTFSKIHETLRVVTNSEIIMSSDKEIDIIGFENLIESLGSSNNISGVNNNNNNGSDNNNNNNNNNNSYFDPDFSFNESSNSIFEDIDFNYDTSLYPTIQDDINYNDLITSPYLDSSVSYDDFYDLLTNSISGSNFDELKYQHSLSNIEHGFDSTLIFNFSGGSYGFDDPIEFIPTDYESSKDYNYIHNLLSNSLYSGAVDLSNLSSSKTNDDNIGKYNGVYYNSGNLPFFSMLSNKLANFNPNDFNLSVVYGVKGKRAVTIVGVTPLSMSQEIDASGEPIYDIYEFIAKDVLIGR